MTLTSVIVPKIPEDEPFPAERLREIEEEVAAWKISNEYQKLSDEARVTVERRMRTERHSEFYLMLAELT